ncbi:MAG: class I SAM-dependent methyltransferase [Bacteroidota bacterium]
MNKITKIFSAINNLIHQPSLINLIIDDESKFKRRINKKYPNQNGLPVIGIENFLNQDGLKITPYAFLEGGSLITDMALLKSLCLKYKVKDYLEFGTWRGESVAVVSSVVENCTTVNLPDNEMIAMNFPVEYISAHRFYSKNIKNISHLQANTLKIDSTFFGDKKFDLIFIDADHHYESVVNDTLLALKLLKNENSVIVWHDYAFNPITVRHSVYAAILDALPEEKRKNLYHISNTLCAAYIPNDFQSNEILTHTSNRYFEISINAKNIQD